MSTRAFAKKQMRNMTLIDIITSSRIDLIPSLIKRHADACTVMKHAFEREKNDVIAFLFKQYHYTIDDARLISPYADLEYTLSGRRVSLPVLQLFLDARLISINQPFSRVNRGETMLDNATKYRRPDMEAFLIALGAQHGASRR